MKSTRIVVLAAGLGKRMKQDIPKALTLVLGKPILQHLVESIQASGIDHTPIIVVGKEQPKLCESFGVKCEYAVQMEQQGTAHATKMTKDIVDQAEQMIVLYGDHPFISKESLKKLVEKHESSGGVLTMMTVNIPSFDGWLEIFSHWGRILRNSGNHVLGIREYKDASEKERSITEVNPALFCFDRQWFFNNVEKIKNNNTQGEYYLTDMVELAVNQGYQVATVEVAPEESIGINTSEERKIAEEIMMKRK